MAGGQGDRRDKDGSCTGEVARPGTVSLLKKEGCPQRDEQKMSNRKITRERPDCSCVAGRKANLPKYKMMKIHIVSSLWKGRMIPDQKVKAG